MIQKIKNLVNVNEKITELSKNFEEHSTIVNTFSSTVRALQNEIEGLKMSQETMISAMNQDATALKDLREDLRTEINDFKIIKSRVEKKMIELFEDEIGKQLQQRFDRLEYQMKSFDGLNTKVQAISQRTVDLSREIEKFTSISKHLKEGDFELVKYAQHLQSRDQEKLELMRKLDTMERLVSKMRRQR
ncbi:hypothetical protein GOV09_04845 [Candidatus Woesearchaeota archaeon]|nr:hypothetical protein [Candidatus Woesearchaeota archaeon]